MIGDPIGGIISGRRVDENFGTAHLNFEVLGVAYVDGAHLRLGESFDFYAFGDSNCILDPASYTPPSGDSVDFVLDGIVSKSDDVPLFWGLEVSGGPVTQDSIIPIHWLSEFQAHTSIPLHHVSSVVDDNSIPVKYADSVNASSDILLYWKATLETQADQDILIRWGAPLTVDQSIPIFYTGAAIYSDGVIPIRFGASIVSDTEVLIRWLALFEVDISVTLKWGAEAYTEVDLLVFYKAEPPPFEEGNDYGWVQPEARGYSFLGTASGFTWEGTAKGYIFIQEI